MKRIANKRHTPMKSHLGNTRYAVTRDVQTFEDMLVDVRPDGSVKYVSDITLLFNQQRLDRMTNNALNDWFRSVARVDSQLDAIRKALPVDAVGKFIKSRYIQSPSELRRWTNYLTTTYKAEYEAALEAVKAKKDKKDASDPAPSDPAPSDPAPSNPAPSAPTSA